MSSKNPFRKSAPSEQEEVTMAPPSPPLPPLPKRTASDPKPPALPPRSPTSGPSSQSAIPTSSSHETSPDFSSVPTIAESFDDELPPPYTPAANGPCGPFSSHLSSPPRRFIPLQTLVPHVNLPPPSAQALQPYPTGSASVRDFRMQPELRQGPAPWQTQQQYRQRQNAGGGLLGALFDTVRDIADVVSGAHDERMMASRRANAGAYATPYPGTGTVFTPPPGSPGQVHQLPPPRSASTPPHPSPPMVPDDGSPTRTPVPGHPLLRAGNLLVYPRNHMCIKCDNTGYKHNDPSHPCCKCWEKYGKPYTGALTYTPWSPSGNDPRMQRPLPKFLPPQARASEPRRGLHPPPPQYPQHSRSLSQPPYVHSLGSGPSFYVMDPLAPDPTPPVPDAIAVSPGDPRMGGRLCMRCGGAAKSYAYVPYSKFRVGAALLCADGTVIKGCNVENAAYGGTICAERTAIVKAVSEGKRDFVAMAVTTCVSPPSHPPTIHPPCVSTSMTLAGSRYSRRPPHSDVPAPISPCGTCRQVLREFCHLDTPILLVPADYPQGSSGEEGQPTPTPGGVRVETVGGLLPLSFGPEELERPRIPADD
ncbi:hypothetical protein J3R83DRAFT_8728 [Lanmaoa asiatica]|nr:hypothetical protein J3R83DRAFT_8728 [Lanmaoa asiatica]